MNAPRPATLYITVSVTSELAAMEKSGSATTIYPRLSRFCRLPFAVRINTPFNAVFLVQRHFWHSTWWTYWSPRGPHPMNSIRFFLYDSKHWRKSDHRAGIVLERRPKRSAEPKLNCRRPCTASEVRIERDYSVPQSFRQRS